MRDSIRIPLTIEAQCANCGALLRIKVEYPVNRSYTQAIVLVVPCKCGRR